MLSSDFITTFLSIIDVSVFSTLADSQRGTEDGLPGLEVGRGPPWWKRSTSKPMMRLP